jgi:hypothetical protein
MENLRMNDDELESFLAIQKNIENLKDLLYFLREFIRMVEIENIKDSEKNIANKFTVYQGFNHLRRLVPELKNNINKFNIYHDGDFNFLIQNIMKELMSTKRIMEIDKLFYYNTPENFRSNIKENLRNYIKNIDGMIKTTDSYINKEKNEKITVSLN